jgi:hypothetical protein
MKNGGKSTTHRREDRGEFFFELRWFLCRAAPSEPSRWSSLHGDVHVIPVSGLVLAVILTGFTPASSADGLGRVPVHVEKFIIWFYSPATDSPRNCDEAGLTVDEMTMCAYILDPAGWVSIASPAPLRTTGSDSGTWRASFKGDENEGAVECGHDWATTQEACVAQVPFPIRARDKHANYIKATSQTTGSVHSYVHGGTQGYFSVLKDGRMMGPRASCWDYVEGVQTGTGVDGSITLDAHCGATEIKGGWGAGLYYVRG